MLSPRWQTFERTPRDEIVEQLIRDSVTYLQARADVDANRLGLTGFCIECTEICGDKAAGAVLLSGRDLSNCALITTGRLSGGMVTKIVRMTLVAFLEA